MTIHPTIEQYLFFLFFFSKLFEKLMYKRLYQFLDTFEVLHPLQFGFREKHFTTHTLSCLTEYIKPSIDNGNFGCGISLDLQKAFGTVNHKTLLQRLEHYGDRDNALNWFQSYLTGRSQYVRVHSLNSGKVAATFTLKSVPSQFSPFIL